MVHGGPATSGHNFGYNAIGPESQIPVVPFVPADRPAIKAHELEACSLASFRSSRCLNLACRSSVSG